MRFRNAERLPDGSIDCEIEHPTEGWVPFTARADDVEPNGVLIHTAAMATNPSRKVIPILPPAAQERTARIDKRLAEVMDMADLMGVTADTAQVRARIQAKDKP